MALGSTQPLTEMSTWSISWGKGGRSVTLTTLPPSCAVFMKSGNLNFLEPSGPHQVCNGTALHLAAALNSLPLSFYCQDYTDQQACRRSCRYSSALSSLVIEISGSARHSDRLRYSSVFRFVARDLCIADSERHTGTIYWGRAAHKRLLYP